MGEFDSVAGALGAVSAGVCVVRDAVECAGEASGGSGGDRVAGGSGADVLDDDGVGEPGGDAGVYDERGA